MNSDITLAYIIIGFITGVYAIAKHDACSMIGCLLAIIVSVIVWPLILIFWAMGYILDKGESR